MSELSAKALNEQIVRMRKVVEKSRIRFSRKLIRFVRRYKDTKVEKKMRKRIRFMEEIKAAKKVHNDDVTKFALINTKELKDLPIKDSTPSTERVLYKMAVEKSLTEAVKLFRKEYPNWRHEVPFLLQRLGMQYQKEKNNRIDSKTVSNKKEIVDEQSQNEPSFKRTVKLKRRIVEKNEENLVDNKSPQKIAKLVKDKIEKVVQNLPKDVKKQRRKKLNESSAEEVLVKSSPEIQLQSSPIFKGEGVIKKLNLNGIEEDDIVLNAPTSSGVSKEEFTPSSSFFLPVGDKRTLRSSSEEEVNKAVEKKQEKILFKTGKVKGFEKRSKLKGNSAISETTKSMERIEVTNDDYGLHPSWLAKKRQAKQLARLKSEAPAKKILFEDSD